jgi:hypothetical protein
MLLREIGQWIALIFQQVRVIVTGAVAFVITFVAGQMPEDRYVPGWVWLTLGFLTISIAQFLAWRHERRRVETRDRILTEWAGRALYYQRFEFTPILRADSHDSGIKLYMILKNQAHVPIRYSVKRIVLVIGGVPCHPYRETTNDLPPQTAIYYVLPSIVRGLDLSHPLSGTFEIEIEYGPSGMPIPIRRLHGEFVLFFHIQVPGPPHVSAVEAQDRLLSDDPIEGSSEKFFAWLNESAGWN